MLTGQIALVLAAAFTGAAFYINFAEHPARMRLGEAGMLIHWKPAYERGYAMQLSLVVAGSLCGLAQWWLGGGSLWLLGALLLAANAPYTIFAIMPTNRVLMATPPAGAGRQTRRLMQRWAALHAGRTLLGLAATLAFLAASLD